MCGIFGVFTDTNWGFSQKQLDILGQNIIINQFRGTDSTGVFQVNKGGSSSMLKVLGGARELFTDVNWDQFQATIKKEARIVVGHGRAATRGSVKIENAHPFAKTFASGEILKLVHNGTLEYQQDLPDFNKFDVDSEWIAEMLVRFGPKEVLGKIRGAMALVWWDEKAKTINFFRNNDRPLHFGQFESQYDKTFILNSESAAVRYLAARNGLKSMEKDDVYYFPPYHHAALSVDNLFGKWSTWEKVEPPKARVFIPEKWQDRRHRYGYSSYGPNTLNEDDSDLVGWTRRRAFHDDLEALRKNIFNSVEFVEIAGKKGDWHRLTTFPNFSSLREPVVEPYLTGLRKMERVEAEYHGKAKQWWVRLTYWDAEKNTNYHTMVGAEDPVTKEINPKINPTNWKDDNYHTGFVDVGLKKFSPGRKFRWTSKRSTGDGVVRHSAVISDIGGHILKGYKNNVDGSFAVGDQVLMEVSDVVPVKIGDKDYFRLDGIRSSPTGAQDACVDCVAYAEKGSPLGDAVEATPINEYNIIAGMVDRIELATKDWHLDTNSYVILVLKDWEMVDFDEVKEPWKDVATTTEDIIY